MIEFPMSGEKWCDAEDQYLQSHYSTEKAIADIAIALGRTEEAVVKRARKHRLKRPRTIRIEYLKANPPQKKIRPPTPFTEEKAAIIMEQYITIGPSKLSRMIGIKKNSIISWARRKGLHRTRTTRVIKGISRRSYHNERSATQ